MLTRGRLTGPDKRLRDSKDLETLVSSYLDGHILYTLSDVESVTWREMYEDWPLQNMPCRHRDSQEALERLCNAEGREHKWSLLEAYDEDELPLPPNEYEKLKGKTVFCSVSISRWEIERKYSFSLHIVQLQILKPPPLIRGTRSIPSRREDDILQSPTKRMRTRR